MLIKKTLTPFFLRLRLTRIPMHANDPRAQNAARKWRRDPLSHPALRDMDRRALGDLPFDPHQILPE